MNKLLHIADLIQHPVIETPKFNMETFCRMEAEDTHPCNTSACIAGYAVFLHDRKLWDSSLKKERDVAHPQIEIRAREILELGYGDATELFMADSLEDGPHQLMDAHIVPHIPDAIRWMVFNETYSWAAALAALGVEHMPEPEDDDDEL